MTSNNAHTVLAARRTAENNLVVVCAILAIAELIEGCKIKASYEEAFVSYITNSHINRLADNRLQDALNNTYMHMHGSDIFKKAFWKIATKNKFKVGHLIYKDDNDIKMIIDQAILRDDPFLAALISKHKTIIDIQDGHA